MFQKACKSYRDASGGTGEGMHSPNVFHDSPAQSWGKKKISVNISD